MHKIRAASFLRRTISEPHPRRRPSALPVVQQGGFSKDLAVHLIDDGASMHNANADLDLAAFTWESDLSGLQNIFCTKYVQLSFSTLCNKLCSLFRLNIALIFLPLGMLSSVFQWGDLPTFWLNFFALIPLARLLGNATEEFALHTGG